MKYGSVKSKEEVNIYLNNVWDITCSEFDSFYFGVYFSYSGLYTDKLTIKDNYISSCSEWLNKENSQFKTLIELSFTSGKNSDKLSKYKFMKSILNQSNIFSLISDEYIEEI